MSIHVVRLGDPRGAREGLRLGTVRRPPRGVPKSEFAARDFYDIWLPQLAPSEELLKEARQASTDQGWSAFVRKYRAEMRQPDNERLLGLLAALSKQTDFSLGCYCADEARCHRSILRELLAERGADMAGGPAGGAGPGATGAVV